MSWKWFIPCLALALISCHRTQPQSPTRRSGQTAVKVDTTVLTLLEINQRMAAQADNELLALVDSLQKKDSISFAQLRCGAWRKQRDEQTKQLATYAQSPKPNENWLVTWKVYSLQGEFLQDAEGVYTIKHFDMPLAIEEAVDDMVEGETTTLYAPWYSAFGQQGTSNIKPYTNVRLDVTLKEKE